MATFSKYIYSMLMWETGDSWQAFLYTGPLWKKGSSSDGSTQK